MRATVVRRTALAASMACLALLATACGGSDSGAKGGDSAGAGDAAAKKPAVKGLTSAELEKMSLEPGDVADHEIAKTGPDDIVRPEDVTVDKKECEPVAFAFFGVQRGTAAGNSSRKAVEKPKKQAASSDNAEDLLSGALDITSSLITLASYDDDGAEKNLAELRKAVGECATAGFTVSAKGEKQTITKMAEEKVTAGDEALAWKVQSGEGESAVPFKLVSFRKGGTVATVFSFNLGALDEKADFGLPTALIDAQAAKLG